MQAENATQVAVQAAWKACDLPKLPAMTNCPGLTLAIQNAIHSTSLGTRISLVSGSPSEGYYCVNSLNALQYVSDVSSKPADCTAAGTPTLQPGDYIQVHTTFTYAPLFRAQRVTHLYLRGSGVRQFGNRFDQLLDECGVQDVVDPNFGHGLLPLTPQQVRAQGAVDNLIC